MEVKHTELLHKEGMRLLKQQILLLNKIIGTKGLLKEPSEDQKKSLDVVRAKKDIDVLEGELHKLENLDMVLAVVGTMKSGKSTTNNAIIGLEVLPNRNRPMTALPTLIRHTPGQTCPVLKFKKNGPVNSLIEHIVIILNTPEGRCRLNEAEQQNDLEKVAQDIINGLLVENYYENENGIFEFLKQLNDLVRLATALDLDFPFNEFRAVNDLPVIEVEFQHLRGNSTALGRLSLLDTPGPNEDGQLALKPMMKEQLKRASGVLAVLDYTQLKSESDADVRRELLEIADVSEGRLSILVNKFDQKDRNSDGIAAVKSLVANELLNGKISEDDVYPVSSRYAYLANRARTELALHAKLPDYKTTPWVKDFAEKGVGRRWEQSIDSPEKVTDAINDLWADSLFDSPLSRVIKRAHDQAAVLAIDSAASKLVENGSRVNNFLGLRETALKKSAEELHANISGLLDQKGKIDRLEISSQDSTNALGIKLGNEFSEAASSAKLQLKKSLEEYFAEGRIRAKKELQKFYEEEDVKEDGVTTIGQSFLKFFRNTMISNSKRKSSNNQHFDTSKDELEYPDKRSAMELLDNIYGATMSLYERVNDALLAAMDTIHIEMEVQSTALESEAKELLDNLSSKMNEQGFDLKLRLPVKKAISIALDNQQVLDNMISEESKSVTKHRRSSGAWGTVCSWFNTDDWGWESYSESEKFYKVNIQEIKRKTLIASDQVFANVKKSIDQDVIKPMKESCSRFFLDLTENIDEIRGDLLQGLEDSNRSKQEQEDLARQLAALKVESSDFGSDMEQLEKESKSTLNSIESSVEVDAVPDLEAQI